jgi:site-specific recombinase XerD
LSERGQRPDIVITDDLIEYFTNLEQKGKKHSTIQRRLIAIRTYYKQFGEEVEKHERERGNHNFIYVNPASTDKMKSWMKSLSRTIELPNHRSDQPPNVS